jgi:SAM-dependent methyltransferase
MPLPRVTELAHLLVQRCLKPGGRAVDATVGNGHDTLFLARLVGPGGRVEGFDLQTEAIGKTRIKTAGQPQVHLHVLGHERMGELVEGPVDAVMFNLGYLPSGDKSVITRTSSTLPALETAAKLLGGGGILTVVVYPGHEGGAEEAEAVSRWFQTLRRDYYRVVHFGPPGTSQAEGESPYLLAAWREG